MLTLSGKTKNDGDYVMSYTNSSLATYTRLSPHNSGTRTHAIDRITPHHVVGLLSVEALGAEFDGTRAASSNYGIGPDGRVGLYVPESCRAWTSGSAENDQRAVTIECADEATWPYTLRDATYKSLINLCADICKRNGKNKLIWIADKAASLAYKQAPNEMLLTIHRFFQPTQCPGEWLLQHMADLAEKVTAELQKSKPVFVGDSTPAKWAKDAVEWAIDCGLMVGDENNDLMLRSPLTREQFCVILKRYHDLCDGGDQNG